MFPSITQTAVRLVYANFPLKNRKKKGCDCFDGLVRFDDRCHRGQAGRACVPRSGALLSFERHGAGVALEGIRRHGPVHPTLRSVSESDAVSCS